MLSKKLTVIAAMAGGALSAAELPLSFEINRGQFDRNVRFVARG